MMTFRRNSPEPPNSEQEKTSYILPPWDERSQTCLGYSPIDQHTAAMVHELRSPLAAMAAQIQVMQARLTLEEQQRHGQRLSAIREEMGRLSQLLDDFLLLAGNRPPLPRPIFLPDLARESVALLRTLFIQRQVELICLGGEGWVMADKGLLLQILINLLANAADASPRGSRVEISVERYAQADRAWVRLAVADQGRGMDQATLDQIFDPFFTTKEKGGGLGLTISRQLAESMGGRLWAESQPDQGSVFYLLLPEEK